MTRGTGRALTLAVVVCLFVLLASLHLDAQATHVPPGSRPDRITQEIATSPVTSLGGSSHPRALRSIDIGPFDPNMLLQFTLNFSLTEAQQMDLSALVDAQNAPSSPQFHQWLTQEQFGERFGLSDSDLDRVNRWLASNGIVVQRTAASRNSITVVGRASQVQSAFQTQLRRYQSGTAVHFANASELHVPVALANVLLNVRGLDDFRPQPQIHRAAITAMPDFTTHSGNHYLSPGDWATIYDVTSIYNAGYTGLGMHVGVVGQTYAPKPDIDHFRSAAGLSATKLNYQCISSSDCTTAAGTSTDGDLSESDLDIEWAGGIAKDATVDFIYAAHNDKNQSVFDALQYAIQSYKVGGSVVPVLSLSYQTCEPDITPAIASYFLNMVRQANAQGQTIVASSGDAGAAGCDPQADPSYPYSTDGASAAVPSDLPNVTSVGGTYFSADGTNPHEYWSSSTASVITALKYIPETAWNETGGGNGLIAGGGGVSVLFATPPWQPMPTNFTGTPGRFFPDVSFNASWDHDGYLICSQVDGTSTTGAPCTNGFLSSQNYFWAAGGTSASAPSFAGMLTLLASKYGSFGNVNPTLYKLASDSSTYAAVFHDTTTGNIDVPCLATAVGCVNWMLGYDATTGYDLATGLGSIDGGALFTALSKVTRLTATSVTVTASPNSLAMGATVSLTATVSASGGNGITGSITFANGSTVLGSATITNGTASLSGVQIIPANGFVAGTTAVINASYSGDTTFEGSVGSTTMTLAALPATSTSVTVTPTSVIVGSPVSITASVSSTTAGTITGTVTFKVGSSTLGTATLSGGTATFNNIPTTTANGFSIGSDTITASYSGDPMNYAASNGTTTLTVQPLNPTTVTATASPSTLTAQNTTTLSVTVASSASGTPTGTVTFSSWWRSNLGTVTLINGSATLSSVLASYSNGLPPGAEQITASYSGDASFAASSGTVTLTVNPIPTTTTITLSPSTIMLNSGSVTANVTVTSAGPVPSGHVDIAVGNNGIGGASLAADGTGSAILFVNSLFFTVGSDVVTASYGPSYDFAASTGTATLNVTPQPATTTTFTVNPATVTIGGTVTLTATVTSAASGTPTGSVNFSNAGLIPVASGLSNGTVTVSNVIVDSIHGFAAGNGTITARYSGDSAFAPSQTTAPISITALPSTTAVTVSSSNVSINDTLHVSASVVGTTATQYNPTGLISVQVNSGPLFTTSLYAGIPSWNIAVTPSNGFVAGANTVTVNFLGDANLAPSSVTATVTQSAPTYTMTPGATSVSLSPGGSASVALNLNSNGYAGSITLAASASSAAITASASSVSLSSNGAGTSTLTITASGSAANRTPVLPWKAGGALVFAACIGVSFSRKRRLAITLLVLAVVLTGFVVSCGGGGSGGGGGYSKPPRSYTVTVTPTGSGAVTNPNAISIAITVQ